MIGPILYAHSVTYIDSRLSMSPPSKEPQRTQWHNGSSIFKEFCTQT